MKTINPSKMKIDVTIQAKIKISLRWIRNIVEMVLAEEDRFRTDPISIVFVDHGAMTEINNQFLQKNYPTDVISFLFDDEFISENGSPWGEVIINVNQAKEQALEYQVSLKDELARLVIHGLLHLLGYDDQIQTDKLQMINKENDYLLKLK